VIENWSGLATVSVSSNGAKVSSPAHIGYAHHLEGDCLIIFLEYSSSEETQVQIDPTPK
jgi:hypothetical protein